MGHYTRSSRGTRESKRGWTSWKGTVTLLDVLRSLEPEFLRIGDWAPRLRAEVEGRAKSSSGDAAVDIVTEADFRLQEEFLRVFLETPLAGCRLWAEESNPLIQELSARFRADNGYYLCLDPIDGTQRFLEDAPYYSSIVSLHDGRRPLYSWIYYPKMAWWMRLDPSGVTTSGEPCESENCLGDLSRVIVYTAGDPDRDCPDWKERVQRRGLHFIKSRDIGPFGAKFLLLRQKVAGYFAARPNPYDGLMAYHYAQVHLARLSGWELWEELPAQGFACLEADCRGLHYPFRYLALRPQILCSSD